MVKPKRALVERDSEVKRSSGAWITAPHPSQTRCPCAVAARWYVDGP